MVSGSKSINGFKNLIFDMQKFEYKVLDVPDTKTFWIGGGKFNYQALCDKLNELGKEGWEVVSASDVNRHLGQTGNVMIILKRPLNEN